MRQSGKTLWLSVARLTKVSHEFFMLLKVSVATYLLQVSCLPTTGMEALLRMVVNFLWTFVVR